MSARPRLALYALLAFTVLAVAIAPVPTALGDVSAAQTTETPTNALPPESTTITIQLQPDGDANWTITTDFNASDEADEDAFREYAGQYERGQVETPWLDEVRASKDAAETTTNRSMNVTNVEQSSNVSNTSLSLRFTWTDFAQQNRGQFVADDVFNTTRGTWLDGLTENQALLVELPPGATLQHAPTGAAIQQGHVRWDGPQQFEPGYMRIAYTVDEDPTESPSGILGAGDDLLWGGFFVLGIGIVVGAYVLTRRHDGVPSVGADDSDGPATPPASKSSSGTSGDVSSQAATAGTVEPAVEAGEAVDEELLSDEERVERLLEANGGRMKQATIVKETDWSNAKVSQLLSAMEADGQINKLRIGRENLISFPDEDITDIDQE